MPFDPVLKQDYEWFYIHGLDVVELRDKDMVDPKTKKPLTPRFTRDMLRTAMGTIVSQQKFIRDPDVFQAIVEKYKRGQAMFIWKETEPEEVRWENPFGRMVDAAQG